LLVLDHASSTPSWTAPAALAMMPSMCRLTLAPTQGRSRSPRALVAAPPGLGRRAEYDGADELR